MVHAQDFKAHLTDTHLGTSLNKSRISGGKLQALDLATCFRLIATQPIGRLIVPGNRYPLVFPVNFGVDDDTVVILTRPGTKRDAAQDARVSFEVDQFDTITRTGWSVVIHGVISEMIQPGKYNRPESSTYDVGAAPWVEGDFDIWMRLVPEFVTGRQIVNTVRPDSSTN